MTTENEMNEKELKQSRETSVSRAANDEHAQKNLDNGKPKTNKKRNLADKDEKLSSETRTLLDEEFWRDATPQKVQELISKGADVNAENSKGMTAAHYAVLHGDIGIIKVLGESGANMNHGDIKAETPAHKVAKNEQSNDVLKELAKFNTDFDQTNIYGESARDMIQKNQQDAEPLLKEIEDIQQKKGADEKKAGLNNTLEKGTQKGKDDPRNEEKTPSKNIKVNPALLNSSKEY